MAYNRDDNSELRALQLTELKIMELFKNICDKHHLRYFMIGGTMLGAVRHQGFIPWDDDMDVGMPRPDYERFLKIAPTELPEGYDFLNYKSTPGYLRYFSRLVDKNVTVVNTSNTEVLHENAWLDIFPLDGMPKHCMKLHFWHATFHRFMYIVSAFDKMVNLNRPGRPKYQQLIINVLSRLTHGCDEAKAKKWLSRAEKVLTRCDYDRSTHMVNLFGAYMLKEIVDLKLLGEGKLYPFETLMLNGPVDYDPYLAQFYGDYMTPPADRDKDKHSISGIEYGENE